MKLDGECNLIGESISLEMQGLVERFLYQRHVSKHSLFIAVSSPTL
jgi:hypothetical protein